MGTPHQLLARAGQAVEARAREVAYGRELCLSAARALLDEVDAVPGAVPEAGLAEVTRVVAIAGSSRGGTSLLHQLLTDRPDTLSIAGEHTAIYKLNRLDRRRSDGSDGLDPEAEFDHARISRDFVARLGVGARHQESQLAGYPLQMARRLAVQWPLLRLGLDQVREAVATAVSRCGTAASAEALLRHTVHLLGADSPGLEIDRYDLPQRHRPGTGLLTPPNPYYCVEEPPFVVPTARRLPTPAEVAGLPLVIKSSVDAYRLPMLRRLFPNAEIRLVHLTRNPAASINGLVDGWLDQGFFSYDVSDRARLDIAGYSDRGEQTRRWWNFDIFPQWQQYTSAPLAEVCAQQWRAAHCGILADAASATDRVLTLRFEDVADPATRAATMARLHEFAGLPDRPLAELPVTMATAQPRRGRWRDRAAEVLPAAMAPDVLDVARRLGYPKDGAQWQ
ncbi:hypothetical protein CFP65_5857 [Kitasatospora sp. MMS16-BH015]|uniref:sulfotransferase n=1 Tax=Kitasatospora sp. MMS16-BH015 TaxID=2018025 RepID=UPI000CA0CD10|nr:sulfotransferase [Kitasatospora sp. MMS16-BH015]AUG80538.1 hypothetical protein CFP65_5857 [Kitasatospora sp. MMS16-BH015]